MDCRYQLILRQMSKMSDGLCHNSAGIVLLTRQEMRKEPQHSLPRSLTVVGHFTEVLFCI